MCDDPGCLELHGWTECGGVECFGPRGGGEGDELTGTGWLAERGWLSGITFLAVVAGVVDGWGGGVDLLGSRLWMQVDSVRWRGFE